VAEKRKSYTAQEKAKVALEALLEQSSAKEIADKWGIHPTQVNLWKKQGFEGLLSAFTKGTGKLPDSKRSVDLDHLFKEVDKFFEGSEE
jgi:transposase